MPDKKTGWIRACLAPIVFFLIFVSLPGISPGEDSSHMLDSFDHANEWRVVSSDDVDAAITPDRGSLRLDFDFNGVSGFASIRRALPIRFTGNYAISLRVRGHSPENTLQVKFIDESGDNVWWINRPGFIFRDEWQTVRAERRQIDFAWGPARDRTLRQTAVFEITLAAGKGGKGRIWFDDLKLEELPPPPKTWPAPTVKASSWLPDAPAAKALDGDMRTSWRSDPSKGARQDMDIDFGASRSFGGLILHWLPGLEAGRYAVQYSDDGIDRHTVRRVFEGNGGDDPLLLTESHTRFLRLSLEDGPAHAYGLAEIEIKGLEWGASPNRFFEALAKTRRRGLFPRGLSGEQSYWTTVGVDAGGANSALISEDGAVEWAKTGCSVEPFLISGERLLTWADVSTTQALEEGYLPMPSVTWKTPDLELRIATLAAGDRDRSCLITDYTVENRTDEKREVTLVLAIRPFQVNPPAQFLNTTGGVSPIHALDWNENAVEVNGRPRLFPLRTPDEFIAGSFDSGDVIARLAHGEPPRSAHAIDDFGYASGAMLFRLALAAHGKAAVHLLTPLSGEFELPEGARRNPGARTARVRDGVAAKWRAGLNIVDLRLPGTMQVLEDVLRSSLAYMLISRDGQALQPGTRSYARTWIRDGAMMSQALLRLGHEDVVADFISWYARHQFKNGKIPCCVDERGADPVPENDSHGEFIFTVAELYRYTHDRICLERLWPHVTRAVDYMEKLRAGERTQENLQVQRRAYYGLMPASISHEGYAAKPVHSYWDDFWALKGYNDALYLARTLGKTGEAERLARARDQFRGDLYASIRAAVTQHDIDYLPGAAELGDFDPASTAIALSPCGEQDLLPRGLLENTYERYWRQFEARRDGKSDWEDYTPYELRILGVFIRLGRRDVVPPMLDFFLADRRPAPWNGWPEVIRRDPRKPGFIGDMPHAWIASDYIRSVLDMFAYQGTGDRTMVLAAGVPAAWLKGEGVGISGLRTPWGQLSYTLRLNGNRLQLHIEADGLPPDGFVFKWPYDTAPGKARINNHDASWHNGDLSIHAAKADVSMEIPVSMTR